MCLVLGFQCTFVWSWTCTFNHYMAHPLWGCSSFNAEHTGWYSKLSVVQQNSFLFFKMEMVSQHILSELFLRNRMWEGTLLYWTSTFTAYGPSLTTQTSMAPWWWWKSKMERSPTSEFWSLSKPTEQSHLLTLANLWLKTALQYSPNHYIWLPICSSSWKIN